MVQMVVCITNVYIIRSKTGLGCRLLARVSHEHWIYYQEMYWVCVYSVWTVFAIPLKDKSRRRKMSSFLYSSPPSPALHHFSSGFTMILFPTLAEFSYLQNCVVSAYIRRTTQSELLIVR